MFNPLSPDLSEMSIDDLTSRLSKLNARMVAAVRSGNQASVNQARVMILEASEELAKRSRDLVKKPDEQEQTTDSKYDPLNMDPLDVGENG